MAKLQNKQFFRFYFSYIYVSVLVTLTLLFYAYWDIIQLRFVSGFFGTAQVPESYQELFIVGFSTTFSQNFTDFLPVIITAVLSSVVAYTLYHTYKHTMQSMDVNHNYINVRKVGSLRIALHYALLYSAAFVIPVLFWCLYLIYWFPALAKLPLTYIFDTNILTFTAVLIGVFMVLLTQTGFILIRFILRLFKIG
jgi:hypothetical protein